MRIKQYYASRDEFIINKYIAWFNDIIFINRRFIFALYFNSNNVAVVKQK